MEKTTTQKTMQEEKNKIQEYIQKNKQIEKEKPLKKSKYTDIKKLDQIIEKTKTSKATITIEPEKAAEIKEITENKEILKKTITKENKPKDQYEAKANIAIEKATIIELKENKEKIKIKIETAKNTCNKVIIACEKNMESTIIIEHLLGENSILGETILCNENTRTTYVEKSNVKKEAIIVKQFILEKDAHLTKLDLTTTGELLKSKNTLILEGEGSEAKDYSLLIGENQNKHDISYLTLHEGKNTKSHCVFKSVSKDQSKNTFEGMIKITENGKMTNALLECHGMIIGNKASTNQIPSLEISNDDVKATHSATMAHIEEEEIFYLKTRGIEDSQAKKLIITSFLESNALMLPENAREEIIKEIEKKA